MKKNLTLILCALLLPCAQLLAQTVAPSISYSPNTYNLKQGTAISSISPVNANGTSGLVPAQIYGSTTTLAGKAGTTGNADGTGSAALFGIPVMMAVDQSTGNIYVADFAYNVIRKITPAGQASIFAGHAVLSSANPANDGTGTAANFHSPNGIIIDPSGQNLYVSDNDAIRKIVISTVQVTTIAGSNIPSVYGSADGIGSAATMNQPLGMIFDASGLMYFADAQNNEIRTLNVSTRQVTTVAGSTTAGYNDAAGTSARFSLPYCFVNDGNGNFLITDYNNNVIRKFNPTTGAVTTFAGSTAGTPGSTDNTTTAAKFRGPKDITKDGAGNYYVSDWGNNEIRKITPAGVVTTIVGNTTAGTNDGIGVGAKFNGPFGLQIVNNANGGTNEGYMYAVDQYNYTVRKISLNGYTISPALPLGLNFDQTTGIITGTPAFPVTAATYTITAYNYYGSSVTTINLAVNNTGLAPNIVYNGSPYTYTVGTAMTAQLPTNSGGAVPAQIYSAVNTLVSGAGFLTPTKMTMDASGNIYLVDAGKYLIRKITPGGTVSIFAGSGTNSEQDGIGALASFAGPNGIIIDPTGTFLYVTDAAAIRKIVIATQQVTTVAGPANTAQTTSTGYADGNGSAARFYNPVGMVWDNSGNLYIADYLNNRIRKMDPSYNVTTFAGSGATSPFANGIGTAATFNAPYDMVNDGNGNLFVADKLDNQIRKIVISTAAVSTFAGNTTAGHADGPTTAAGFSSPKDIAIDGAGNFYGSDFTNNLIREITPAGAVTTIAGSPTQASGSLNGTGTAATFNGPFGLAIISTPTGQGNMYIVDQLNNSVRKISLNGYTISPALPAGLAFDSTTGQISGTPAAVINPATYSVTAYNYFGSSTTPFIFNPYNAATIVITPTCNVSANGSITVTESVSGNFSYSLDGGAYTAAAANTTPVSFTNITPGTHTITAKRSSDNATSVTNFTIAGAVYTWTGTISSDPTVAGNWSGGVAPLFDGSCSITIPNTCTIYPILTANESIYSLTIQGSPATFNLNGFTLSVGCNIINSTAGGLLTYGASLNSTTLNSAIYWNGTSASQTYTGNSTLATAALGNMTVNNKGGTVTISGGPMDVYNILTMTNGNLAITSPALFTLKSSATQTAAVAQIVAQNFPGGNTPVITGNVNVERYITGGAGYRGYRLLSSPVNISSNTTGGGNLSLAYLNKTVNNNLGALTGGPGGNGNGFTVANNNPTIYLFDETKISNNTSFVSGKNIGITAITSTTVSTLAGSTSTSGVNIPVGNSYLMYFIGDTHVNTVASSRIPDNTTITATGYLNQGDVPVTIWNTNSTALTFTTGTGAIVPGLNQVGNPYASTISLDQFYADNNAINPNFYEMNEPGQNYYAYNAANGTQSGSSGKYIASGQGFVMASLSAGQTITFKEDQKVNYQFGGTNQPLVLALKPTPAKINAGMHLQLSKSGGSNVQTGVYFSSKWSDTFNKLEDAVDFNGLSSPILLSSQTFDGTRVAINSMGDYVKGKRVKLFVKATASARYNLKLADIKNIDTIYNVLLVDKLLKDSVDLRTSDYNFNINTADTTTFGGYRFELAVELKVLPDYKLVSFTGKKTNAGVQLNWTTLNEGYYTGFVLQKQTGTTYTGIDSLQSSGSGSYSYLDDNAAIGLNTYRLKQIDAAGNITYSALVNVNTNTEGTVLTVYPNPARESVSVNVNLAATAYIISIYNSLGAIIKQIPISSNKWTGNVASYNPGTYIIEVNDKKGNFVGKTKFVKIQ